MGWNIEIIDIECILLSFLSENFVSTKWRISKGIFSSSSLLWDGILVARSAIGFFCQAKFTKKYEFETLSRKMVYKNF